MTGDIETFAGAVNRFGGGEISEAEFRSIRVPFGIYEQRESGTYMMRVRCSAGVVGPEQLRCMAVAATEWGAGPLHITTRQEFQIHGVRLKHLVPVLRSLAAAGLSTKGGGGNTVRNITGCPDASVCAEEQFDVTPHARGLTRRMMDDPVSFQLPRKFKVAFSGCGKDCAGSMVNDVGFIAEMRDGVCGFSVYVGGGMGGRSRIGAMLHEFIPAGDAALVTEAIKRVFDKNGDRRNKHLARLRWLVERMGFENFKRAYLQELAGLKAPGAESVDADFVGPTGRSPGVPATRGDIAGTGEWRSHNVRPQKQGGFFIVDIPAPLGDLPPDRAIALADIAAAHGERQLCATQAQNIALRWVREAELAQVESKLGAVGLADPEPPVLRGLVACAGASTCRLGICLSRGLAKAVRQELLRAPLCLDELGEIAIHISGCPNSCGRHPMASIGMAGAARKINGRLAPFYSVHIGGRTGRGLVRFGTNIGALPARNAAAFARDLLVAWQCSTERSDFHRFVDNGGMALARDLLERHQQMPARPPDREFFQDWDSEVPFSMAGRGAGECSAGVFDLIEVDLMNAREWIEAGRHYAAALAAARALLITRRLRPADDRQVFEMFDAHFVATGHVDDALGKVVAEGARCAEAGEAEKIFAGSSADVAMLLAAVRLLYDNMDASLRLPQEASTECCGPGGCCDPGCCA